MKLKNITDKQLEFWMARDRRLNFLTGSVSSGKTWISILKFINYVRKSPATYEFLLCGKTITSLRRNCFGLLTAMCGQYFSYSISVKAGWLFGRRVYLEGANDERAEHKIRGITLGGAYCDEVTLFPETFANMLLSRLREPGAKLYATANPDRPDHYIKRKFLDNTKLDLANWKFVIDDNTFLDAEYVTQIKREYTGVFYQRYIEGIWVTAEGAIYREFIENEDEFYTEWSAADRCLYLAGTPHKLDYVNIGVDWGGNSSGHAFVATGITKKNYVVILSGEWHNAAGTTPEQVCKLIISFIEKVKRVYGKVDDIYADSSEQLLINLLREKTSVAVRNSLKHPIIDRVRFTTALMAQRRLYLTRDCDNVAKFFKTAVYDSKALVDRRLDDGSYDQDSGDAFEYSIERYMNYVIRE